MHDASRSPDTALSAGAAELLRDVLRRVRLNGAVFLRAEFTAPWAFVSADAATLCTMLPSGGRQLVLFHIVIEGSFRITASSGETAVARAGDAVVLPYCDVHHMGYPDAAVPVPIASLLPALPWDGMPVIRHGGGGPPAQILCGYLQCDDLLFSPILRGLPRLIIVPPVSAHAAEWRQASMRYALDTAARAEPGAEALLTRLPELVFLDCLRQYVEGLPQGEIGWLAALKDPVVADALVLIHADPAAAWTVTSLARRVAVSRSVLADRFRQAMGVSPKRYLTEWRLQLAADLLYESTLSLADLAGRVGYESEAAFSRAFKRHLGAPPAAWRDAARRVSR
jgi:AraC family transcriptional regulator, alkane utilization regulator